MNDDDLQLPAPTAAPDTMSQATAIEQSRAVAEVQAAVTLAALQPRNFTAARAEMQQACSLWRFADRAFFRFPRGGSTVTGASIYMARELARCYRNIEYGIAELARDDEGGTSQMMAFAWDLETNTRSTTKFIVPHARDKNVRQADGTTESVRDPLSQLRDIYENNANMAARRVRQMIFAVLPPHFVDEAEDRASVTLRKGDDDGASIADRAVAAVGLFAPFGVDRQRIEQKLGRPLDKWDGYDLAQLRVAFRSIERSEVSVDQEFPVARLTVADITPPADAETETPTEPEPEPETTPAATSEPEPAPTGPETQSGSATDPDEPTGTDAATTGLDLRSMVTDSKSRAVTVPKAIRAIGEAFPDKSLADFEAIAADDAAAGWLRQWVANDGSSAVAK